MKRPTILILPLNRSDFKKSLDRTYEKAVKSQFLKMKVKDTSAKQEGGLKGNVLVATFWSRPMVCRFATFAETYSKAKITST